MNGEIDDLAVEWLECEYCGATYGEWCKVARGRTMGRYSTYLHSRRMYPLREAMMVAHRRGEGYLASLVLRYMDDASQRDWLIARLELIRQENGL